MKTPWTRGADVNNVRSPSLMTVRDANGMVVAFTTYDKATNLIAAAPDLLDALQRIMRHIPADFGGASFSHDWHKAQAAIAKAGGAA